MTLIATQPITDPSDISDITLQSIYADWGYHVSQPAKPANGTALKSTGLTIADYTTRFINPIFGAPKEPYTEQQRLYIGYIVMAIAAGFTLWYVLKRG